jgi:predicted phosphodiesterase
MKKIAVFSDIHGNLEALEAIFAYIKNNNYDEIIYLGDAIGLGPNPKECLNMLKDNNVIFLLGNHELYYLYGTNIDSTITNNEEKKHQQWVSSQLGENDRKYLESCKLFYMQNFKNRKYLFTHYLISDINAPYPYETESLKNNIDLWLKNNKEYDCIVIGHEHDVMIEDDVAPNGDFEEYTGVLSNIHIVGSSGCTKNDKTSFVDIVINEYGIGSGPIYLPYDREKFVQKCLTTDFPNKENILNDFFGINCKIK